MCRTIAPRDTFARMHCQRCGTALRQGQATCVACGAPTGMYMRHQGKGAGCVTLVLVFLGICFAVGAAVAAGVALHVFG